MIVVYGYSAASHSLGVALHSGSGGLCRGLLTSVLIACRKSYPKFKPWLAEFPSMWEAASQARTWPSSQATNDFSWPWLAMARHDWSCLAMGAISGHAPPRPAVPSHGWAHTAGNALICLTSMTLRLFCERSFS